MIAVFPDVEKLLTDAVKVGLADNGEGTVPVATQIPDPRPAEFIRIYRLGGQLETLVSEAARASLDVYAATEARAVQLLNLARAVLKSQWDALWGYDEFIGPNNLPDPITSLTRYTCSFEIRTRLSHQ